MREYGDESWELDALEPSYLVSLVELQADMHIDTEAWDERREVIESVRSRLKTLAKEFERTE